ncbi:surface lipoprotein assembly modifier [Kerstersia gyiorum]|uniref:surface lipoprotein assembly modifier n=1 Tax=Kerstersia gyiorum TaxID=206506 RepID=UPI003FF09ADA
MPRLSANPAYFRSLRLSAFAPACLVSTLRNVGKVSLLLSLLGTLATNTLAQTVEPPRQEPIENLRRLDSDWQERLQPTGRQQPAPPRHVADAEAPPPSVTDDDLRQYPQLAEIVITASLHSQDWKTLAHVLHLYQQSPGHDPQLVRYGQGAILRQQRHHSAAIAQYRDMLNEDASLDYVRFDLAAMLFENKQYRDARTQFEATAGNETLPPSMRQLAQLYLNTIDQQQRVVPRLRLRLIHNSNVNQSGDERDIIFSNVILRKPLDAMPQSSWGTNYALILEQEANIGGNHFLAYDASVDGLRYTSLSSYDENAIALAFHYKNQTVSSWLALGPALQWQWLDGKRYSHGEGLNASIGHWFTPSVQVSTYARWLKRHYYDVRLRSYEGDTSSISPGLLWMITPRASLFAGLSYQRDSLAAPSESFRQRSINAGFATQLENGLNLNAFAQIGFRRYDAVDTLLHEWRKDRRFTTNLSIGHSQLTFAGFEPKLGLLYERVRSSHTALYTRRTRQWMLTLEKRF